MSKIYISKYYSGFDVVEVEEDEDEEDCGLECPLGGDETDDCADCVYSCDHHFVNGECVRREENE